MFSRFFIDRPIFAAVLSIFIVIAGLASMRALPIAQYPQLAPPEVSVGAVYVGASAQVVEAYRAQFGIGQRTLLDVLNAENELYRSAGFYVVNLPVTTPLARAAGVSDLVKLEVLGDELLGHRLTGVRLSDMPARPLQCIGMNVRFIPMKASQKCQLPARSLIRRPVIFG